MEDWRSWRGKCNRLPNLRLLESRSNGSKSDILLVDFYNDMNDAQKVEFCEQAFLSEGVSIEVEKLERFYEKRKAIPTSKIRE